MQSLRTRKAREGANTLRKPSTRQKQANSGAAGREISAPVSNAPGVGLRERDARKSRLDDKIKKRMSMRYADAPRMPADPMPDIPALPAGLSGGSARRDRGSREKEPEKSDELDMQAMGAETFDPDAYLKGGAA